jgi:hypothetical protein
VLSTITVWPSVRLIRSARMRASVSVGPPAVNGTTSVICFDGKVCALAPPAARLQASIRPAMNLLRIVAPNRRSCHSPDVPTPRSSICANRCE